MDSKREKIMKRIAAVLAAADGVSGRVYRSDPDAATRAQSPCIVITWQTDQPSNEPVVMSERELTVSVQIITRGDAPDALADPVIQSVHALLMADPKLNNNAIDIIYGPTDFEFESADQTAGRLTQQYRVLFRHNYHDLTA